MRHLTEAQASDEIEQLGAGYFSGPVSRLPPDMPHSYRGLVPDVTQPARLIVELDGPYSIADLRAILAILERVKP